MKGGKEERRAGGVGDRFLGSDKSGRKLGDPILKLAGGKMHPTLVDCRKCLCSGVQCSVV